MIAVSLNVGGGVRLIKSAKLHVHANHYKRDEDGRMTSGVRGRGCVPRAIRETSLRALDYTHTHIHTQFQSISKHHICTQNWMELLNANMKLFNSLFFDWDFNRRMCWRHVLLKLIVCIVCQRKTNYRCCMYVVQLQYCNITDLLIMSGFNGPLWQYFSLSLVVSHRDEERWSWKKKKRYIGQRM